MQFKHFIFVSVFVGLFAFTLGVRLMGKSSVSVFAPENFVKKDSEKLDDLMEERRMAARHMKIRNPKSKII